MSDKLTAAEACGNARRIVGELRPTGEWMLLVIRRAGPGNPIKMTRIRNNIPKEDFGRVLDMIKDDLDNEAASMDAGVPVPEALPIASNFMRGVSGVPSDEESINNAVPLDPVSPPGEFKSAEDLYR